jgi:hypothetical protein
MKRVVKKDSLHVIKNGREGKYERKIEHTTEKGGTE